MDGKVKQARAEYLKKMGSQMNVNVSSSSKELKVSQYINKTDNKCFAWIEASSPQTEIKSRWSNSRSG